MQCACGPPAACCSSSQSSYRTSYARHVVVLRAYIPTQAYQNTSFTKSSLMVFFEKCKKSFCPIDRARRPHHPLCLTNAPHTHTHSRPPPSHYGPPRAVYFKSNFWTFFSSEERTFLSFVFVLLISCPSLFREKKIV